MFRQQAILFLPTTYDLNQNLTSCITVDRVPRDLKRGSDNAAKNPSMKVR
jgi:hypothetical protein